LQEAQSRINAAEFQKHLVLVSEYSSSARKLIGMDKRNQIESNISFETKVYMPTDAAFREQATIFEEAVSDLYKNAKDNFSAHW
jgi:hypothetical protein